MATNRIMVFGGGTVLGEDGAVRLHPKSVERAERAIDYYRVNKELFMSIEYSKSFILCTGGFGLLSAGVENLKEDERESVLVADYLVEKGGIPPEIILLEKDSTSTLTNWTNSLQNYKELLDTQSFTDNEKLGLVSHPYHLERVAFLAEKLGYRKEFLEMIPTIQIDNQNYETQLLAAYKQYLKDANDSSEMIDRENDLAQNKELMSYLGSLQ